MLLVFGQSKIERHSKGVLNTDITQQIGATSRPSYFREKEIVENKSISILYMTVMAKSWRAPEVWCRQALRGVGLNFSSASSTPPPVKIVSSLFCLDWRHYHAAAESTCQLYLFVPPVSFMLGRAIRS
jgi:hypothetical protein